MSVPSAVADAGSTTLVSKTDAAAVAPNCRSNSLRSMRIATSSLIGYCSQVKPALRLAPVAQFAKFRGYPLPAEAAYCTTSVIGIECERLPDVPVIINVYVPERAGFAALIVSTEDAVPDTIAGLTEAETRRGVPLTESETGPANPCS